MTNLEHGVRILNLDGGGSKGIAIMETLRALEMAVNKPLCECYDLAIGSSIGGVIVMHLCLDKSMEELAGTVKQQMSEFSASLSLSRLVFTGSMAAPAAVKRFLAGSIDRTGDQFKRKEHDPFVCVTTTEDLNGILRSRLIRNYGSNASESVSEEEAWTLGEAMWATTAFPSVVQPCERNGKFYRDGGLLVNNPVLLALNEVMHLWPGKPISYIHSLGFTPEKATSASFAVMDTFQAIFSSIAECGTASRTSQAMVGALHPTANFRRLELPVTHHSTFIADPEEYCQIVEEAAAHIAGGDGLEMFELMAKDITKRSSGG